MNRKFVYGIAAVMAISAVSAMADQEAEKTLEERVAELEAGAEKSSWTEKVKIKADLRYRYEYVSVDGGDTAKNRQRIRVRLGAYADVNDFTTAGIRIRTGGDANSGNQTIGGDWNNKDVFFDLAYVTIAPEDGKYGAATLGKMKYPWKAVSDLIWDGDVNPEGIAYTYAAKLDNTKIFSSVGGFKVDDTDVAHDLNLVSAQIGATQPLGDTAKLTVGSSLFSYHNAQDFLGFDCKIAEAFSEVSFKNLPVPVKFYGNYVNNVFENDDNQGACAGVKFGDKKKGKWEAKFDVRRLEEFAAPADFADSDFAGGGTDVKGFRAKGAFNIAKHLQFGITGISGKEISSGDDVKTLHLDLIAKF